MNLLQRLVLILALCLPASAFAQLSIAVDSVDTSAFPDVRLHVNAALGNLLIRDLDSSNFSLREDGMRQSPLHHQYPPATTTFSVVFVISTGALMSESGVDQAKGIVDRMMNWMSGYLDEAAIFSVGDVILGPVREMTSDVPWLRIGLNSVQRSAGGTHLWDGAYAGANYCVFNGIQPVRAMVLLSNGKADGGTKTASEVIAAAKVGNITVYTIGINAVGNDQDLKLLAQQTGGEYYANGDLAVQEIGLVLSGRPHHSILEYRTDNACRDGFDRQFAVQVKVGSDSVSTTATAALSADPGTNVSVTLKPENTTGTAGTQIEMPFSLNGTIAAQRLYGGTLSFRFDTSKIKLTGVNASGMIAESNGFTVASTADGGTVTITGVSKISASGTLFKLKFQAANLQSKTVVPVALSSATFTRGCLTVTTGSGSLTINPKQYKLTLSASPVVFNWNTGTKSYDPDPGLVTMDVRNDGDLPVSGLTATLAINDGVRVAYGGSRTATVEPSSLDPGKTGTATWYVQAIPRPTEGTERVNALVESIEGATADKDLFMNIKAADLGLRFSECSVSDISIVGGSYQPNPAVVSTKIVGAGTADAPAGAVTIVLPASGELTLNGGTATQSFGMLPADSFEQMEWTIDYPTVDVDTEYDIMLVRTAAGLKNDTCRRALFVPALNVASLEVVCSSAQFAWDPITASYVPNPGMVGMTVTNNGTQTSAALSGTVVLPQGISLASGQVPGRSHGPLAPGESWTEEWLVEVGMMNCGADLPITYTVTVTPEGGTATACESESVIGSANSGAPVVNSFDPPVLDKVALNDAQSFAVDAADPDGTTLSYLWQINGIPAPSTTETLTHTFDQLGAMVVRCAILDACAEAGEGDTTFVTWQFEVKDETSVARIPGAASEFALLGNYPNPFNPGTTVQFSVPAGEHDVTVDVLDASGRTVAELSSGTLQGGRYTAYFDASRFASGTYFARLRAAGTQLTMPMLLVK